MKAFVVGIAWLGLCLLFLSCDGDSPQAECQDWIDGDSSIVDGDDTDGDEEDDDSIATLVVPESISFGAVLLGTSISRDVTLFSGGPAPLEIYQVELFTDTEEISMTWAGETLTLYPSEAATVTLTYEPTDAEGDTAELLISSNAETKLVQIPISSDYKGASNLQTSLDSVEFGLVPLGDEADAVELRITNLPESADGNKVLTISRVYLPENAGGAFTLTDLPQFPVLLGPNQFMTVSATFSPVSRGEVSGILRIENDSDVSAQRTTDLPLSGAGGAPSLCPSPESLDFSGVRVNQSRTLSLTLTSCGETSLDLSSLSLQGTNADLFELVSPPDLTIPMTLAANDELDLDLRFSPTDASGVKSALLVIASDDASFPSRSIALSGSGVESLLVFQPNSENFEDVEVGNTLSRTISLVNQGGAPSVVERLELTPSDSGFSLGTLELPLTLEPQGSVEVELSFVPESEGAQSASLRARDDGGETSEALLMQGRGIAAHLGLSEEILLDFSTVRVGEQQTRSLSLSNSGLAPLRVQALSLEGPAAEFFQISPEGPFEISSGSPVNLTLTYTPQDSGNDTASLVLRSNDMDPTLQTFRLPLSAKAIRPTLQVQPSATVDFGDLFILAQSEALEVTLANIGTGDLLITSLEVPDETPGFVVEVPGTVFPVLLEPQASSGDTLTFNVSFSPSTNIPYESVLVVHSNGVDAAETQIVLSGTGILCPQNTYDCDGNPNDCETFCDGQVGSQELCDGIDNNCNCEVDEGYDTGSLCNDEGDCCTAVGTCGAGIWECDRADSTRTTCSNLPGGSTYAGVAEVCDGQDNNCDGVVDNPFIRQDNGSRKTCSGVGECADGLLECDPNDPGQTQVRCNTNPGGSLYPSNPVPQETCDGLDNDCDGLTDEDYFVGAPCAGVGVCQSGYVECDGPDRSRCDTTDPDGSRYEGQAESCDGLDNDCDGMIDEGYIINEATGQALTCEGVGECDAGRLECATTTTTRCNTLPGGSFYQGTPERCDALDNDCDGLADEGYIISETTGQALTCDGVGACGAGVLECSGLNAVRCSTDVDGTQDQSQQERCDTLDNDCDGLTDETYLIGQVCTGMGLCPDGVWECASQFNARCSTSLGGSDYATYAQNELCDGEDNDCDGEIDELWPIGELCEGTGACGIGRYECAGTTSFRCSTNPGGSQYSPTEERCDDIDHDCDGNPTNGFHLGQPCDSVSTECTQGVTQCSELGNGEMVCSVDFGGSNWEGTPEVQPSTCDGLDNDCDGIVDEPCRVSVYRHTRQLNPVDHDQKLSASSLPDGGWTLEPDAAFAVISSVSGAGLGTLYCAEDWINSGHYYTTDLADYNAKISLGWDDCGSIGYIATSDPADGAVPLVRLYSESLSNYWYSVDLVEQAAKLSEGYVNDSTVGWVWLAP